MENYTIFNKHKIFCEGTLTAVIQWLHKVINNEGHPYTIEYDNDMKATRFDFEGFYCNFSLFLKMDKQECK